MIKIIIPCFFKNETSTTGEIIGKEIKYKDYDVRPIIFYHINAVSYYNDENDNDKEYACIHSNDTEFISSLTVKEVEKLIDNAII